MNDVDEPLSPLERRALGLWQPPPVSPGAVERTIAAVAARRASTGAGLLGVILAAGVAAAAAVALLADTPNAPSVGRPAPALGLASPDGAAPEDAPALAETHPTLAHPGS